MRRRAGGHQVLQQPDGRDWNDGGKYLANAGVGTPTVTYTMQPGLLRQLHGPLLPGMAE